ncbi:MAG TPA: cyclase family protein [Gemmatimonadota bacterium]|jgi:kynurenine formamidase
MRHAAGRGPSAGLAALGVIGVLAGPSVSGAQVLDLSGYEIVDLTHAFDARTLYWPTSPFGFGVDTLAWGPTEGGFFYSSLAIRAPEHGGTHLDAPIHFNATGISTDRIPLEQLVAPAVVIDVRERAAADPDYTLTADDVDAFESRHGRIGPGTIVLLRTGWDSRYGDRASYFGSDRTGDASDLHFPSYGEEAARLLVGERRVALLGVDTASIDPGPSKDFPVHRVAAAAQVPGLENLANLGRLPATGALVLALPMKIAGGTGGPARVIALVPRNGGS